MITIFDLYSWITRVPPSDTCASSSVCETPDTVPPGPKDIFIAVMGITGVGKSTLVSLCTGKEVEVGHSLGCCTKEVAVYSFRYNSDTTVYLIDTPGFDDDTRSDSDVLKEIAAWLTASYSHEVKLSGIVYLHRITDGRLGGSAKRNLSMFQKLCGEDALSNVILATTMWEKVDDPAVGEQRENELKTRDEYWGYMLANGSQVFRLMNNFESAMQLLDIFASKCSSMVPTALEIQVDMVDRHVGLESTGAGKVLNAAILRETVKLQGELMLIRDEIREALARSDQTTVRQHQECQQEVADRIRRLEQQSEHLKNSLEQRHLEQCQKLEKALRDARNSNARARETVSETGNQMKEHQSSSESHNTLDTDQRRASEMEISNEIIVEDTERPDHEAQPPEQEVRQPELPPGPRSITSGTSVSNIDDKRDGWTALGRASLKGKVSKVKTLIERGALLDICMDVGWRRSGGSALNWAAANGHLDVVRLLVLHGARLDIEAQKPKTPDTASTPVAMAASNNHLEVVRFLMKSVPKESADKFGRDALLCACKEGHKEIARFLVDEMEVSLQRKDAEGKTVLHYVAGSASDRAEILHYLIEKGADVHETDNRGKRPLHYALQAKKKHAAIYLFK